VNTEQRSTELQPRIVCSRTQLFATSAWFYGVCGRMFAE